MEEKMYKLQERRVRTMSEYRIKETIGSYFNRRFEVQKKYTYYENGEMKEGWLEVFHNPDRKRCEEVLARRKTQ